jgi:sensor domain DACNV-containing protein
MQREPYPAARTVSPRLRAYFARQAANQENFSGEIAAVPGTESIEQIIDTAFWASLRREEGFVPKISLAFLSPRQAAQPFIFERPLPVEASILTRISPAVERAGIHLGVWHDPDTGLHVWGAVRGIPRLCFVVEVAAPGLIVIKNHTGETAGKFVNVAVLEGDLIKVVSQEGLGIPDSHSRLSSLLGLDSPASWVNSVNVLVQLAVSMRSHGHGGSLLVVPSESDSWRDSIVPPVPYALSPPFSGLAHVARAEPEKARRTIDAIAGLTAVDGALVMTDQYEVLGFGAKITRRRGSGQVEQIRMTEPIEGGPVALVHPEQLGGTRHLSAAQFVKDQPDAVALVASQDQRFTIFEWSPREEIVHAHRVEALLL